MYGPEILDPFDLLGPFSSGAAHGDKMAAAATVFRDTLTSVVPAGVRVTSPTLLSLAAESSATVLYP
jgi:hypothetical protein